jgi:hypothetical protein
MAKGLIPRGSTYQGLNYTGWAANRVDNNTAPSTIRRNYRLKIVLAFTTRLRGHVICDRAEALLAARLGQHSLTRRPARD